MKTIGYIYAIGAAVTWGLVYTIDERILTKVSPITLLFFYAVLNVILLLPILFFNWGSIKEVATQGKSNFLLIILSVALAIGADFFILSGIKVLGASTASIFEIVYPFFIVVFTFLFFQETVSGFFMLGAILMFIGAVIITRLG